MHTPQENTFSIYRSSAGSGKTYQLAIEFISMAIANPNLFNRILAVTFTNKATKEMKERILDFLLQLADHKNPDLLKRLVENTSLSESLIAENAKIVLGKILHQYAQFSVSTIDAFFQKVVKSFAKELGLMGNYKVELDQDKIKQELIDQIIGELGNDKDMTDWLVEFSFTKVDDNKNWNIRPQIESLANEVFKESFRPIEEDLHKISRKDFQHFLNVVRKLKSDFEKQIKSLARQGIVLIEKSGLSVDDFSYKGSGPAGYFDRIVYKNDFEPKTRVAEAIENPEKWCAKTAPNKEVIRQCVDSGLLELTASIVGYYNENVRQYTTAVEVLRNFYVFGILTEIIKKLKEYRYEHDVMLISDVPVFLRGIIAENDAPFIYEKTGSWYQHYLIDEFQDTSGFQWQNFRPLLENGLSQGYKSMLVGDGKQSIYRWRGGDWNLILHRVNEDLLAWKPNEKQLNINWRSSGIIVQFNNAVFAHLPGVLAKGFKDTIPEDGLEELEKELLIKMSDDAVKLYEDAAQQIAPKHQPLLNGRIEVNVFEKDAENPWKESVLEALPKQIEQLQENGFEACDIAILVRKSDEGKQVIEHLLKYKKSIEAREGYCYDAISNESLFLGNASVIRLIVNTIKYATNPDDKIAFGEIAYYYQSMQNGENLASGDLDFILDGSNLPSAFAAEVANLLRRPVYEMVERIIQIFSLGDPAHKGYLQAFQDVVLEYFANESKDLIDFLAWWEDKGWRKSIQMPGSINAIRVMTIHKSKGLEFKAVLLPFCDWKLDHEATKDNILWCKTNEKPFDEIGWMPLKYNLNLLNSYFALEYFEEKIKAHIDNLNLLYVALTRAEAYLMVNCKPPGKEPNCAGDLVVLAMEKIQQNTDGDLPVVVMEEFDLYKKYTIGEFAHEVKLQSKDLKTPASLPFYSSDWRQKIAVRKKGAMFFGEAGAEIKAKINYGLLLHEILATIQSEKEASVLIAKYQDEGRVSSEDGQTLADQLHGIFANYQVRSWFNTTWQVKTEVPIVTKSGKPHRPDRVLIDGKNAIVIDFKTGLPKPADKTQVLEYRALLQQMGHEHTEAYLLYILTNEVIQIA